MENGGNRKLLSFIQPIPKTSHPSGHQKCGGCTEVYLKEPGGLIVIETKEGNWKKGRDQVSDEANNIITLKGYQVHKEFYSPVYLSKEDKLKGVDLRNSLYRNPDLKVGPSGKTSVTFYNSNVKMEAVCTVEGRNGGRLGSTRNGYVVYYPYPRQILSNTGSTSKKSGQPMFGLPAFL